MTSRIISLEAFDDPDACSSSSDSSSSQRTQRKMTSRKRLVQLGVDAVTLAILDTKISIAHQQFTVLDTIGQQFKSTAASKDPAYVLVETVEREVQRHQLNLERKQVLFSILEWEFECLACKRRKRAMHFMNSSYLLWGLPNRFVRI
ncbi:hypothetical protein PT974_10928 [Cladobotryum mycophilum]|uniref:Uncharacterized protein n=1 Tax=Cladobotryum mycophilum TaxID=491253 RepID=A0ABR0SB62_9HYPO